MHGFLDFQLAGALTQSLLLGGVATCIASALEIEAGFFDRLVASPIPRVAIVLGRLLAAGVVAGAQVAYFLILGLVVGAHRPPCRLRVHGHPAPSRARQPARAARPD